MSRQKVEIQGLTPANELLTFGVGLGGGLVTTDGGPAQASVWGVAGATVASADMSGADAALIDAPPANMKFVITDVFVSVDTAMQLDIKEEASGLLLFSGFLPANNGFAQITPRGKRKTATAVHRIMGRTSAAGNVRILVGGYYEA